MCKFFFTSLSIFFISYLVDAQIKFSKKLNSQPSGSQNTNTHPINKVIPVDKPWEYYGKFPFVTSTHTVSTKENIENLEHTSALLNSLCAWEESTTVLDITHDVSVQIPVITAKENGEKYSVFYMFKKYTNIDSGGYRYQVGVEVRLVANFVTLKGSLNLSLSSLGINASAGKLSGTVSLALYGASLPKIGEAFTTTSSITAESIEKVLQQIATLKSTIFDNETIITPFVIGFELLNDTSPNSDWNKLQLDFRSNSKSGLKLQ